MQFQKYFIFFSFFIFFGFSCTGESGVYDNQDASTSDVDADSDSETCPTERDCGLICCEENEECFLGSCQPVCETERCRGICCEDSDECVNNMECLPKCLTVRCGENLTTCCHGTTICLDGVVCAADCDADESLCGADLNLCCPSDTVCLNDHCIIPGGQCSNNFDCPDDTWYCEETIGECLPLPTGPICEGESTFTEIDPVLEWYWPGIDYNSNYYENILAAPTVGDVNGDGTPDIVVVVYHGTAYSTQAIIVVLSGNGDGAGNPRVLFTVPGVQDPTAPFAYGLSTTALANFDNDPGLEIVYVTVGGEIRIIDNDGVGTVCDEITYPGCQGSRNLGTSIRVNSGPAVTDFNHDGMPDILIRGFALNGYNISDPTMDFMGRIMSANTVVADLDQDGNYEAVTGNAAVTVDPNVPGGTDFWTSANGVTSGFIAVADILPDVPGPEVVNIRSGFFLLDGQTGEVLIGTNGTLVNQAIPIPGAGTGGAPTIADFDGDGLPEISTAGTASYVVYDPDCWATSLRSGGVCSSNTTDFILWSTPTQDISSSVTGSSVFDFQGDGVAEVIYNDECFLHIYDGETGTELVNPIIPSSSRTSAEYPLVADADGDGNAEIIVIANADQAIARDHCDVAWKNAGVSIDLLCQYTTCVPGVDCDGGIGGTCSTSGYQCDSVGVCQRPGGTHGVRLLGDSGDMWVRTRPTWPQFSYHVSDVVLSGGIWSTPINEQASWLGYNNYRQNVQGGALFPVADLSIELTITALCPSEVKLTAVVYNSGSSGTLPGVEVEFFRTDLTPVQSLGVVTTQSIILPGGWERITYIFTDVPYDTDMDFAVTVNGQTLIEECNDTNNENEAGPVRCISIE
jgi:hypothetical protein